MNPKKHLSFGSLINGMSSHINKFADSRQTSKTNHTLLDAVMSGFACMYFQDPSLLQFQKELSDLQNRNNLETLFGVKNIPKSTQLRDVVDTISSEQFSPIFKDFFSRLQRGKHLEQFQLFPGMYLCSIDGTQYFSSDTIHCSGCLTTEHKNGDITFSHKTLQAAIMHPDMRQVIPLMPEEIRNTDGHIKQDCEMNAAKRLIPKIRNTHSRLGLIIVGDGLFAKQPIISKILSEDMHYIIVVKPKDHKFLMEWIEAYNKEDINLLRITDEKGRIHEYEWINNIPLNGKEDSISVNYVNYKIISEDKMGNEKVTYKSSWITDLEISEDNVQTIVRGGRCRWKIENECFNTLKNQGYHIEHNYGHGEDNLCFNFFLLTLLAFFFHQIFEATDHLYRDCRIKFGSKRHLWQTLRSYIKIIIFKTWEHLLDFALTPLKYDVHCQGP